MLNLETQTLTELIAQASDDLHVYADASLIDSAKLIGEVARCNETLGVRINKIKQVFIPVNNTLAELPRDFYKLECAFAIYSTERYGSGILDYGNQVQQTSEQPCNDKDVVGCGVIDNNCTQCLDEGCMMCNEGKYWIERKPAFSSNVTVINNFVPLAVANHNLLTSYSPIRSYRGHALSIDQEEGVINLPFQSGEVFFSYLANLTDPDTGELLVPFHPKLNPYYLYTVKTKILEDIFMNSEADVERKLAYAKRERNLAFTDAVDFVMSAKGKAWLKYNKERELEFYNKWFKLFK
jgi:hypothetical protein